MRIIRRVRVRELVQTRTLLRGRANQNPIDQIGGSIDERALAIAVGVGELKLSITKPREIIQRCDKRWTGWRYVGP